MTVRLSSLAEIAGRFDAIVLDQWGVLHDGTKPYPGAVEALERLRANGTHLAVLSNSGKRATPNRTRIAGMGFAPDLFSHVMTSGEALWQDIAAGHEAPRALFAIERMTGDARAWANGLAVDLVDTLAKADAVLLMGLPDMPDLDSLRMTMAQAAERELPVYCTNPDRLSPRADGAIVISPGTLAHDYASQGGKVRFYGKPHLPVFRALETTLALPASRLLMVGDSLEHDIAGARTAGWASAFVEGGLHAPAFKEGLTLPELARQQGAPLPDFTLATLG